MTDRVEDVDKLEILNRRLCDIQGKCVGLSEDIAALDAKLDRMAEFLAALPDLYSSPPGCEVAMMQAHVAQRTMIWLDYVQHGPRKDDSGEQ